MPVAYTTALASVSTVPSLTVASNPETDKLLFVIKVSSPRPIVEATADTPTTAKP